MRFPAGGTGPPSGPPFEPAPAGARRGKSPAAGPKPRGNGSANAYVTGPGLSTRSSFAAPSSPFAGFMSPAPPPEPTPGENARPGEPGAGPCAAAISASVRDAGCGLFWLDEELRVRRANAAFARIAGRSEAALIGVPIAEIDPGWPHGPAAEAFGRLRARSSAGHATRLRRPGGDLAPVQMHVNLLTVAGFETLFGVAVDARDRQAAEDALARTQARYRSLVEDSPELVSRWVPGGALTFANRAYRAFFGLPAGAARGEARGDRPRGDRPHGGADPPAYNVYDGYDNAAHALFDRQIRTLTPRSPVARVVIPVRRRDGALRQVEWAERAFFDAGGELMEMQSVGRDVTERLEADARLAESERRHRTVLDDLAEMVNRFRPADGLITYANRAFLQAKGAPEGEIVGRMTIFDHLSTEAAATARAQLAAVTPAAPSVRALLPLPGPDGATRWEEWTNRAVFAAPDPERPGEPRPVIEFQSVGRDVTAELAYRDRCAEREQALAELAKLSPREREVLRAVARGDTNRATAERLGITERTVEKHRGAAMRKLGVRSAAELVRAAIAAEDGDRPPPPGRITLRPR